MYQVPGAWSLLMVGFAALCGFLIYLCTRYLFIYLFIYSFTPIFFFCFILFPACTFPDLLRLSIPFQKDDGELL